MTDPNIKILQLAVKYLGPLAQEMVFIGGATVGLYIDDPQSPRFARRKMWIVLSRWRA